ncbi:V-type ATP synthase subunit E [Salinigranum salinum]|uniref:V-type ATP synthase subunit E n=1 Tax=Salinigranum salinum TaxID=1364937 RepID=UPI001260589D|nr:V-type ATP synthase subunit E [Salinigranum salinum]
MSLDTVVEDIRDEARARAEEIRTEGQERADEIVSGAEADAEDIVEERERTVERKISQEREQALSAAKLEAKQERLEARRDALQTVREQVESELAGLSGDEREELTRALLDASAAEFDEGSDVVVRGRAADEALIEEILADYEGFSLGEESVDCLGGVVVESEASRVRVDNTFDSLLDTVWENNLKDVSGILFDQ